MSNQYKDDKDPRSPKSTSELDERGRPDSPGQGPLNAFQLRNRTWTLSIVLAIVTVTTMMFAWRNLKDWFLIIAIVFAGTAVVLFLIWKVPKWQVDRYRQRLRPKDQVELEIQARSTLMQIVGGVAVLVSIVFTAANLQLTAKNVQTAQESSKEANELARLTQITERYATAVQQLESKDLEVRLAGIYSLEILAKENAEKPNTESNVASNTAKANEYHMPIMLVLAAHLRNSSAWKPPDRSLPNGSTTQEKIPQDIQTILTVIGRRDTRYEEQDFELDLHGTDLRGADMENGHFEKVNFRGCNLAGAQFSRAFLKSANLGETDLTNAVFDGAHMETANLEGATLRLTSLRGVHLEGAKLNLAKVENAIFDNANLEGVEFNQATGSGNYFQGAQLKEAKGLQPDWVKNN